MHRPTDSLEEHIDREREVLRSNLAELEDRVRSVVDWRRHYRGNPAMWMGIAFAGGLLMALMAAPRADASAAVDYRRDGEPPGSPSAHRRREISRAWRTIESALIGVAASKLKETLAQVMPGFREQLARREGDGYAHDSSDWNRSQH